MGLCGHKNEAIDCGDRSCRVSAIKGAVAAERERCALMLESNVMEGDDLSPTQIAFNRIWRHEAKRIRESSAE